MQRGATAGKTFAGVTVTSLILVLAACASAANHAANIINPSTTGANATTASALSFREVLGELPYGVSTTASVAAGPGAA